MIHIKTGAPLWSNTNWKKAYDWALGQFGDTFIASNNDWYFKNEQDAVLFALRWA